MSISYLLSNFQNDVTKDSNVMENFFPVAIHATGTLNIPTYDLSNECVHPSIYDAGEGNTWNGHRYWLGMSPYPASNDDYENPSIVVSENGLTWSVPEGLTNPIAPMPLVGHNSDPNIFLYNNILYLDYLYSESVGMTTGTIRLFSSSDGVTWNLTMELVTAEWNGLLSPIILYHGGQFKLWSVDSSQNPNVLEYRTASSPTGTFSAPTSCTLTGLSDGLDVWHVDIVPYKSGFHGFFVLCLRGQTGNESRIHFAESVDGLTWEIKPEVLLFRANSGWVNFWVYKSTAILDKLGKFYHLWYSGANTGGADWGIGYTKVYLNEA